MINVTRVESVLSDTFGLLEYRTSMKTKPANTTRTNKYPYEDHGRKCSDLKRLWYPMVSGYEAARPIRIEIDVSLRRNLTVGKSNAKTKSRTINMTSSEK